MYILKNDFEYLEEKEINIGNEKASFFILFILKSKKIFIFPNSAK